MTDKKIEQKENDAVVEKNITVAGGNQLKPLPKKVKARRVRIPKLSMLQSEIKKYIIGQDKAVDRITLAVYRSIKIPDIKSNILIIGKSGSGKTETVEQLARVLNLPYTIEDSTKFTKEGYIGKDVEEAVYNLLDEAEWNIPRAERGMLIFDEIDKKVNSDFESDISGKDVLNSLLKIVEGTRIPLAEVESSTSNVISTHVDTSKMIVIFMGAFSGIEEKRKQRLGKRNIGFGTSKDTTTPQEKDIRYTKDDLIAYGMPIEFVGRIDTIIEFETLSKESLARIAKESKLSIFKRYESFLNANGIKLEYDDSIFDEIAEQAISKNTGARELSNVANEIFEPILSKIFTADSGKYKKCILKNGFVKNPETAYVLE